MRLKCFQTTPTADIERTLNALQVVQQKKLQFARNADKIPYNTHIATNTAKEKDMIRVQTVQQGAAVLAETAYDVKAYINVVAFYVDAWGETGCAWPVASFGSATNSFPTITFESAYETNETPLTEVCFPDFPGWDVHTVRGGKVVAVCLTRR